MSLQQSMSAAEHVKHKLRGYFSFVGAAMEYERCSTHAKEVSCGGRGWLCE